MASYDETSYTCSSYEDYVLPQDYEPSIYNLFDYDPTPYIQAYYNVHTHNSYSTITPTQPISLQYYHHEPESRRIVTTTFYDQTPPAVSATSDFNAPEFDEYDATPYGGGYDIVQTYGRPLPASDEICYPRGGSKPAPAKKTADKPPERPKPEKKTTGEEEKRQPDDNGRPEVVSQIPSGYGLEAIDLCGSIFGYWPCLAKYYSDGGNDGHCHRNACRSDGCRRCNGDLIGWGRPQESGAADYLFGGLDPYVERRDGGGSFGQPIHCYERHRYQEQPLVVQFDQFYEHVTRLDGDHEGNSWARNLGFF